IHFFLMDLEDIRANDFGAVSQEGSGSALKSLLKEEFYRTMTLVEGCVPLWWVVPAGSGIGAYREIMNAVLSKRDVRDAEFVDMGDLVAVSERELMGAALWQMHKALDDPLKSVIKMALIVSTMDTRRETEPLCNVLKRDVQDGSDLTGVVDPYLYVLRRVEDHYGAEGDDRTVDLLRKCFYLKVSPNIRPLDLVRMERNDKASIMVDVVRSWGWSLHAASTLNRFETWDVDLYRSFGDDIHSYLKKTTVQLIRKARTISIEASIDEDIEVEVLRRRIEAFYVTKHGKIEAEKRVKKREPAYRDLYFVFRDGRWSIFERMPAGAAEPVMAADRVAGILAWLVYNKRFDASTAFHMVPNTTGVVLSDIQALLWKLNRVLPDAASIGLDRASLMEDKYAALMVVVGNMECPDTRYHIRELDIVYMNTWKELFCISMKPEQLRGWMARMRKPVTDVHLWLPKEAFVSGLTTNLASLVSP
ncbi:MAG TPA: class I adenylate cyclase, partial [Deltaproteobacteria bacterium]|nr:class I adenylate cyclase [Deltaproteobacteria bacterium]